MHARGMHAREVRFDFRKRFMVLDAEPGLARMSVLAAAAVTYTVRGQLAGGKSRGRDEAALRSRCDACSAAPNGVAHINEMSHVRRLLGCGAPPRGRRRHHSGEAGLRFLLLLVEHSPGSLAEARD